MLKKTITIIYNEIHFFLNTPTHKFPYIFVFIFYAVVDTSNTFCLIHLKVFVGLVMSVKMYILITHHWIIWALEGCLCVNMSTLKMQSFYKMMGFGLV